jgi:MazG family protein
MILSNRPNDIMEPERLETDRDQVLMHVPIGRFIRGAMRLERREDGLVQPCRFSAAQMDVLEGVGRTKRAVATSGITIDFLTTGDQISFTCLITRTLDETSPVYREVMTSVGDIGRAEDGVVDGIDISVDGRVYTVPATSGTVSLSFDNHEALPLEVIVYLPCIMSVAVGDLASTGSIEAAPQRDYMLVLGDSIAQGFVVGYPSQTWPVRVANGLGLDVVNQSVAGYVFDEATLTGMFKFRRRTPRGIIVAYGTNDWARKESTERIEGDARAYLDRLERYFPGVPVWVVTPLWRADSTDAVPCGKKLTWVGKMLRRACKGRPDFHVVDGGDLLPHDARFMADGRLHPNSVAAEIISDKVLDAIADASPAKASTSTTDEPWATGAIAQADVQTLGREGAPGAHPGFDALVRTIWRLRQPDGCPWDKVQTHPSIAKNMIEEAYEAVDAIEQGDDGHLREELGDVLMQVLLHAQIAQDAGSFTVDDVVRELDEKLVRRHPHVFGDHASASSSDEVVGIWNDVKLDERRQAAGEQAPAGLLDSVPRVLPSLMQCLMMSKKAAACGFEWDTTQDVWDKVDEERGEFLAERGGTPEAEMEFGDVLFALVNVARKEGIDAEGALRASCDKFRRRWEAMEKAAEAMGRDVSDLDRDALERLWNRAKEEEGSTDNLV